MPGGMKPGRRLLALSVAFNEPVKKPIGVLNWMSRSLYEMSIPYHQPYG